MIYVDFSVGALLFLFLCSGFAGFVVGTWLRRAIEYRKGFLDAIAEVLHLPTLRRSDVEINNIWDAKFPRGSRGFK